MNDTDYQYIQEHIPLNSFLFGVFGKLRKASIRLIISACLSAGIERLGSH